MSAPSGHVAGTLVRQLLTLRRRAYKRGAWTAVNLTWDSGADSHVMQLVHYDTTMLEWTYHWKSDAIRITGTWTGRGSTSDQTGVNSALRALGSDLYYTRVGVRKKVGGKFRDVDPGAARINNPPVGLIPGEVEELYYQRTGRHTGPYRHKFGRGTVMVAMPNGDVVLRSTRGKKLWGRY